MTGPPKLFTSMSRASASLYVGAIGPQVRADAWPGSVSVVRTDLHEDEPDYG